MILVIDYGAGNVASVVKALAALGADVKVSDDPSAIRNAERVVLPGVGHFSATSRLNRDEVTNAIRVAISNGTPFLGICVGMQWLFEGSTETDSVQGLAALRGVCERFPKTQKVPHVGWNSLDTVRDSRLLYGVPTGSHVYYTHSYRAPLVVETVGVTEYAGRFSAAVERANLFGVQFHPEKSGDVGLQILRNFLEAPRC